MMKTFFQNYCLMICHTHQLQCCYYDNDNSVNLISLVVLSVQCGSQRLITQNKSTFLTTLTKQKLLFK